MLYYLYYTIYVTYSCIMYCYLFISNIHVFYIMYIATQTHEPHLTKRPPEWDLCILVGFLIKLY